MDQKQIGHFLKTLRKENGMTQEQLAERLNVASRTVSRWENAKTMPDFDVLIELAKLYDVSVDELLNGARNSEHQNSENMNAIRSIAEYTDNEKERLLKNQHFFAWIGVLSWIVFLGLKLAGLDGTGWTEKIASFAAGMAFAMSIVALIYTSKYLRKIRDFKYRLVTQKRL